MMSQRHVAIPSRGAARLRFRTALAVSLSAAALALSAAAPGAAATLKVGPGQKYAKPSAAFQAAGSGDVIEINAAGDYGGDVATIARDKLTVRGVGRGRVKIPAKGRIEGGKAIWVIRGHYVTVENIEFSGARAPDRNGAGIRAEGQGLTVRRCRFYDCQDGILGGAGEMLIEYSEFDHCGLVAEPATHSCYIGERCTKLAFHGNYSTRVVQGHLLKSRARENWVLYNRLTDETGTGSRGRLPQRRRGRDGRQHPRQGPKGPEQPRRGLWDGGAQVPAERPLRGQQHDVLRTPPAVVLRPRGQAAARLYPGDFATTSASGPFRSATSPTSRRRTT